MKSTIFKFLVFLIIIELGRCAVDNQLCPTIITSNENSPRMQNKFGIGYEIKTDTGARPNVEAGDIFMTGYEYVNTDPFVVNQQIDAWWETTSNWARVIAEGESKQVTYINLEKDRFSEDACKVSSFDKFISENSGGPFAWRVLPSNTDSPTMGPIGIFYLNISKQMNSSVQIDGRNAMRYESCTYHQSSDTTFKFTFYYMDGGSSANGNAYATPAQVKWQFSKGGRVSKYRYDFINYQNVYLPEQMPFIREIPIGFLCKGGVQKPFPPVPTSFSYRVENLIQDLSMPGRALLTFESEQYDFPNNVTTHYQGFTANDDIEKLTFGTAEVITIRDFKMGVVFQIQNAYGNCTINTMSTDGTSDLDRDPNNPSLLKMRDPLGFFTGGRQWTYSGRKTIREIFCYCWSMDRDWQLGSNRVPSRWELCIAHRQFLDEFHPDIQFIPVELLVAIQTNVPSRPYIFMRQSFNYFDVTPPGLPGSIDTCYGENQKRHFVIRFPRDSQVRSEDYPVVAKSKFLDTLRNTIGSMPVTRISPYINVEVIDDIFVSFTLFEVPENTGPVVNKNPGPSTDEAVNRIRRAVEDGNFKVMFPTGAPQSLRLMSAHRNGFYEVGRRTPIRVWNGVSAVAMSLTGVFLCILSLVAGWAGFLFLILPRMRPQDQNIGGAELTSFTPNLGEGQAPNTEASAGSGSTSQSGAFGTSTTNPTYAN